MILKNNTAAVLNVAGRHVLPKQNVTVTDAYAKNPVVVSLIKAGRLVEVAKAASAAADGSGVDAEADAGASAEVEGETAAASTLDAFKEFLGTRPTLTKLKAYAKKSGIDIGEAKTEDEIVAVVTACLTVA